MFVKNGVYIEFRRLELYIYENFHYSMLNIFLRRTCAYSNVIHVIYTIKLLIKKNSQVNSSI